MAEDRIINLPTTKTKLAAYQANLSAEAGWVGKILGTKRTLVNIAAVSLILLFVAGIVYSVVYVAYVGNLPEKTVERLPTVNDFWLILTPFITLIFGFLFGSKTATNE